MIVERLLAGNVFRENQRRFRNMIKPNPLDLAVTYKYELNTLWCYKTIETIGKAVSCASWCHINGDLLAIGYGVYNFVSFADRTIGYVCIWSIKVKMLNGIWDTIINGHNSYRILSIRKDCIAMIFR